ncbi:hypothetical protein R7Q48_06495 [Vibrio sp. 378]|jgi:hypothetical protein|uniref:hypothetical protein n=1 Tax=Vibrio TaxID=662 RepID=UPI00211A94F0|nr:MULTISPECIES: hypothetical protein [Vibrio]MCQ9062528.1 hypothetical protein [Vibrio alginolyticus]MDW2146245.1 hypothetical protein [Vibrio sp. 378]
MRNPETNPFSLFFKAISENYTGIIAIILVGSACYLWLLEKTVPDALQNLILIVVSFLFGQKSKQSQGESA